MPVCVKNQQNAIWLQDSEPFPVDLQMVPDNMRHVPAYNKIKGIVGKWKVAKIPLHKLYSHSMCRGRGL